MGKRAEMPTVIPDWMKHVHPQSRLMVNDICNMTGLSKTGVAYCIRSGRIPPPDGQLRTGYLSPQVRKISGYWTPATIMRWIAANAKKQSANADPSGPLPSLSGCISAHCAEGNT